VGTFDVFDAAGNFIGTAVDTTGTDNCLIGLALVITMYIILIFSAPIWVGVMLIQSKGDKKVLTYWLLSFIPWIFVFADIHTKALEYTNVCNKVTVQIDEGCARSDKPVCYSIHVISKIKRSANVIFEINDSVKIVARVSPATSFGSYIQTVEYTGVVQTVRLVSIWGFLNSPIETFSGSCVNQVYYP
jgi:hypothetical protein